MSIQSLTGTVVQGPPVTPTAVASRLQASTAQLGEVLKSVIHRSGAFATEDALDAAERAVTDWVSASVPASAMRAMDNDWYRAVREDVSERVPPGGAPVVVQNVPAIDYDRLAAAILAAQQRAQAAAQQQVTQ